MKIRELFEAVQNKVAVVGWGRGMGHKGHMYLADAVIAQAQKMNAQPFFFVSKTYGKDDPLTPEEKLYIYKKVFPKYSKIFSAQANLNDALAQLGAKGFTNVVVVVGADQKDSFKYLERANKEGVPISQTFGLQSINVISRQETPSQSAGLEGPRATPMREVLKGDIPPEQAYKVWRDAMPDALSDQEVSKLMNLAKERLAAYPVRRKKVAK